MEATGNIRSLILEKEKELHDINEYRIRTLEGLLREKETQTNAYKQKFFKLQDDFKYNLKLLEGRDEELVMYDSNFANLKSIIRDREAEISELHIQVGDLEADIKLVKKNNAEKDIFYQQKIKDMRTQVETARWSYEEELRKLIDEMDVVKRKYDRDMREKNEEIDVQRRELTTSWEETVRHREHESKHCQEELLYKIRDLELKVKSSLREMETTKERNLELRTRAEELQIALQESEKSNKAIQWDMNDIRTMKDSTINDLEMDKKNLQQVKQTLLDEYEVKMAELLQSLHSVEKAFMQQKSHYDEEMKRSLHQKDIELKAHIGRFETRIENSSTKLRTTEETLETTQSEYKQAKWEYEDQLGQKDREIDDLKSDMKDVKDHQYTIENDLKNQLWDKEKEIHVYQDKLRECALIVQELKEKESKMKLELHEKNEKYEELQKQYSTYKFQITKTYQDQEQEVVARFELRYRELEQIKERLQDEAKMMDEKLQASEGELQRTRTEMLHLKSNINRNSEYFTNQREKVSPIPLPEPLKLDHNIELSPLWSNDNGPPSILPISTPLMTPPVNEQTEMNEPIGMKTPNCIPALQLMPSPEKEELMNENTKLKAMIRSMTEEITKHSIMPSPIASDHNNSDLMKQLQQSQEYCTLLQNQIQQLQSINTSSATQQQRSNSFTKDTNSNESLKQQLEELNVLLSSTNINLTNKIKENEALQQEIFKYEQQLQMSSITIEQKTKHIELLQNQLNATPQQSITTLRPLADYSANTSPVQSSDDAQLQAQCTELKAQLEAANVEIARLSLEREQLMELSNQLTADLRKYTNTCDKGDQTKEQEIRLAELTQSLEEYRSQNKILKKELRKFLKLTSNAPLSIDRNSGRGQPSLKDLSQPRRQTVAVPSSVVSNLSHGNFVFPKSSDTKSNIGSADNESKQDDDMETKSMRSEVSLSSTKSSKKNVYIETPSILENNNAGKRSSTQLGMFSERNVDDTTSEKLIARNRRESSAASLASSHHSTSNVKTNDARQKLQHAKEILALAGKKPETKVNSSSGGSTTSDIPARRLSTASSARSTDSQRKAMNKLKEVQSKRAEMVQERQKVRNYNIMD